MQARMKSPAVTLPGVLQAAQSVGAAAAKAGGVSAKTLALVHLRASQINGCSLCVDMHARELKEMGESDERLFAVAAWHETPYFDDAERAALTLTEAATRISDRPDAVSDEIWREAERHYDEPALGALVIHIALINFWNRVNVTTRQPPIKRPR